LKNIENHGSVTLSCLGHFIISDTCRRDLEMICADIANTCSLLGCSQKLAIVSGCGVMVQNKSVIFCGFSTFSPHFVVKNLK
jgi:hypothetical protein